MDGGMGMKRRMNKGWQWLARIVLLMVAMGFVLLMAACGLTSEPSDADGESSATQLEENGSDKQKGTIKLSYAFFAAKGRWRLSFSSEVLYWMCTTCMTELKTAWPI